MLIKRLIKNSPGYIQLKLNFRVNKNNRNNEHTFFSYKILKYRIILF